MSSNPDDKIDSRSLDQDHLDREDRVDKLITRIRASVAGAFAMGFIMGLVFWAGEFFVAPLLAVAMVVGAAMGAALGQPVVDALVGVFDRLFKLLTWW
jgi:small-conductance mechanosensitive channel